MSTFGNMMGGGVGKSVDSVASSIKKIEEGLKAIDGLLTSIGKKSANLDQVATKSAGKSKGGGKASTSSSMGGGGQFGALPSWESNGGVGLGKISTSKGGYSGPMPSFGSSSVEESIKGIGGGGGRGKAGGLVGRMAGRFGIGGGIAGSVLAGGASTVWTGLPDVDEARSQRQSLFRATIDQGGMPDYHGMKTSMMGAFGGYATSVSSQENVAAMAKSYGVNVGSQGFSQLAGGVSATSRLTGMSQEQAASMQFSMGSASTSNQLMAIGVRTIGKDGTTRNMQDIVDDVVKKSFGGRTPSKQELDRALAPDGKLRANLQQFFGADADTAVTMAQAQAANGGKSLSNADIDKLGFGKAERDGGMSKEQSYQGTHSKTTADYADDLMKGWNAAIDAAKEVEKVLQQMKDVLGPLATAKGYGQGLGDTHAGNALLNGLETTAKGFGALGLGAALTGALGGRGVGSLLKGAGRLGKRGIGASARGVPELAGAAAERVGLGSVGGAAARLAGGFGVVYGAERVGTHYLDKWFGKKEATAEQLAGGSDLGATISNAFTKDHIAQNFGKSGKVNSVDDAFRSYKTYHSGAGNISRGISWVGRKGFGLDTQYSDVNKQFSQVDSALVGSPQGKAQYADLVQRAQGQGLSQQDVAKLMPQASAKFGGEGAQGSTVATASDSSVTAKKVSGGSKDGTKSKTGGIDPKVRKAVSFALSQKSWRVGYCDNFVGNCWGHGASGYASAWVHWNSTPAKYKHTGTPPAGALVYYQGGRYGHIAFSLGGGKVRSTDFSGGKWVRGVVGTGTVAAVGKAMGHAYVGWTEPYYGGKIEANVLGGSGSYGALDGGSDTSTPEALGAQGSGDSTDKTNQSSGGPSGESLSSSAMADENGSITAPEYSISNSIRSSTLVRLGKQALGHTGEKAQGSAPGEATTGKADNQGDKATAGGAPTVTGKGVERWRSTIIAALKANGLPTTANYVNAWLRQVKSESGGNEKITQQIRDVNSGGNEAQGLLQTIPPTFKRYMFPGHGDIHKGYDNALAAINYAKNRYGKKMLSVIGHGHGYSKGAYEITQDQVADIHQGEMIVPAGMATEVRRAMAEVVSGQGPGSKSGVASRTGAGSGNGTTIEIKLIANGELHYDSRQLAREVHRILNDEAELATIGRS